MLRATLPLLIALIVAGCGTTSQRMTAHASFGCSSTDYKGGQFQGSTDDGCGYKLIGRIGGGVKQPIIDTPEKGEPIDSEGRPDNLLEAELGYVRHGNMDFNGLWLGTPDTGTIKADGFLLGLVYTRRLNDRFDLFASGGAHRWKVKENEVFGGMPESRSASGTSPYLGLGGRYWIRSNIAIRGSWERFVNVGDQGKTGEGDIDNLWLGIDYLF